MLQAMLKLTHNNFVKAREYIAGTAWNAAEAAVVIARESTSGIFELKFLVC